MRTLKRAVRGKKLPTPRQAEAWIAEVIQPLLRSIGALRNWIERRRSVTWRFYDRSVEFLSPVADMIPADSRPLLEQLERFRPEVAERIIACDKLLSACVDLAAQAYDGLLVDPEFQQALQRADSDFAASATPAKRDWEGAFSRDDRPKLAAEYVVNNVQPDSVPPDYTTREFWSRHGSALIAFRGNLKHRERFAALDSALDRLKEILQAVHETLSRLRDELADQLGLPAVVR